MPRVTTNKTAHNYAIETTFKAQPTTGWRELEINSVGKFGAEISTVTRSPISKNRQRQKGAIVGLASGVEIEVDLTRSSFRDFAEGFMYATGTVLQTKAVHAPTAVVDGTPDSYTIPAAGALLVNTLVHARGFTDPANNGLKTVGAASTTTSVNVTNTLVAEASPPTNAELAIAGHAGAVGDITMTAGGDLATTLLDWTTLGLTVGQFIFLPPVGSTNGFVLAGNEGLAQITAITANLLSLQRASNTFQVDAAAGVAIHVYFGQFLRNVATDHASFLEQSYHFERVLPDLGTGPADRYQYAKGNYANTMALALPLEDKATASFAFVGTDTPIPTATRATGAATAIAPNSVSLFGTASNITRLSVALTDETGISTDFKDVTLNINNNVGPEVVLGTLGAKYINFGNFEVDIDGQAVFTNEAVAAAVRNHTTVRMDFTVKNDDGGIVVDIPACTIGDGSLDLPANESVLINQPVAAHQDSTLGFTLGVSLFPYMP